VLNFKGKRVYLACGKTDMRLGIRGLAAIVEGSFKLDPFAHGTLFAFCNRTRNLLKVLAWEEDGFGLYTKRIEKGHYHWPKPGEEATMTLTSEELQILLGGARVTLKIQRNEVIERIAM
jgi:transposase